jgi:sigma-54-dependent transcriptional regulator
MSERSLDQSLRERLEALWREAESEGALGELRHLLEEYLAKVAEVATGADDPIPAQYGMVGASAPMRQLFALLDKVVSSDVAVLIQGESGTG